ncbi:hypothetical protein ABPG74_016975 [Tetrahymena malaccensis]
MATNQHIYQRKSLNDSKANQEHAAQLQTQNQVKKTNSEKLINQIQDKKSPERQEQQKINDVDKLYSINYKQKDRKAKSDLNTKIKMKAEDYMNEKISDNLFKRQHSSNQQQLNNFCSHKSQILNVIEDVKDFLNQKSLMTLYMQSLNNSQLPSKGLINPKYQIKHSDSNRQNSQQQNIQQQKEDNKNKYEFTALLDWEQTPEKYRNKYLQSQQQMDSIKQDNFRSQKKQIQLSSNDSNKQMNQQIVDRKKSKSLHLSPDNQRKNLVDYSVQSQNKKQQLLSPISMASQSPQHLKLSDLNLKIIKKKSSNQSDILHINQDFQIPVSQQNTIFSNSKKSYSMHGYLQDNIMEDKWQKVYQTGTVKVKEAIQEKGEQNQLQLISQLSGHANNKNQNKKGSIILEGNKNLLKLNFEKFKSIQSQEGNKIEMISPKSARLPIIQNVKSYSLARSETERDLIHLNRIHTDKSERQKKFKHIGQTTDEEENNNQNKQKNFILLESQVNFDDMQNRSYLRKEQLDKLPNMQLNSPQKINGRSLTEEPRESQKQNKSQTSLKTQLSMANQIWITKNPAGIKLDYQLNYVKKSKMTRFDTNEGLKAHQVRDFMQKKIMVDSLNQKIDLRQIFVIYVKVKSTENEVGHLDVSQLAEDFYRDENNLFESSGNINKNKGKRVFIVESYFIPIYKTSNNYIELQRDTQIWVQLLKRLVGIDPKTQLYFFTGYGQQMKLINQLPEYCNLVFFHANPPQVKMVKEQFQINEILNTEKSKDQEDKNDLLYIDEMITGQTNLISSVRKMHKLSLLEQEEEIQFVNNLNKLKTKEDISQILNSRSHVLRLLQTIQSDSSHHKQSLKQIPFKKIQFPSQNQNQNIHKPLKRVDSFSKIDKFPKEKNSEGLDNAFLASKKEAEQDKKVDIIFFNKLQNQKDFYRVMNRLYKPISDINLNELEQKTSLSRQELIHLYSQYKSYVAMAQDSKNPKNFQININALSKQSYGASLMLLERVEPLITLLKKEKQLLKGEFSDIINNQIFSQKDYKLTWEEFLQDYLEQKQIVEA